jgi:hypothetical protein
MFFDKPVGICGWLRNCGKFKQCGRNIEFFGAEKFKFFNSEKFKFVGTKALKFVADKVVEQYVGMARIEQFCDDGRF